MKTSYYPWSKLLALALGLALSAGCSNASKTQRILEAANRDFKAQKYDKAEAEYQSVFRVSSRNPVAIRQLGFIYFEEGRSMTAFQLLEMANKLDNKNTKVQLELGEIYGRGGKLTNALPLLESVLKSDPGNEHALLLMAQISPTNMLPNLRLRLETQLREGGQGPAGCHVALGMIDLRSGNFADAEAEFKKAAALDPKLPSPYLGLSFIYSMQKDAAALRQAVKTAAELSPVRSEARLQLVTLEFQSGEDEQARQLLLDMTHQAPDYIPAWLVLMRMYFETQKYEDCQAAIEKILALDNNPPNFEALVQLGRVGLEQHDASKALNAFQRLEATYGARPNPEVKYFEAQAHLMNHEKQKAMGNLGEALTLDRDYTPAVLLLADLDAGEDKSVEAISLLTRLIDKLDKHRDDEKAQLDKQKAQFALAGIYQNQQKPDHALEVFMQMQRSFNNNPEIPRRIGQIYQNAGEVEDQLAADAQTAGDLVKARTAYNEKVRNFTKAREAYERSLGMAPNYLATLQNITELDLEEKRFEDAHHRVAAILENNPKSADALLLQGKIYAAQGATNQAESAYSKAIENNPEQPEAYLNLALLYVGSHQEQQAVDRLAPLVARTNLSAMLQVGEIEQLQGKYEQARDTYEKMLAVNPGFWAALNNLAYVDSEYLSNVDKGLQLAEKARELRPKDPVTADTLGWILFKKHQYSRALSLIKNSADAQPNDPEIQMHLGMADYMMEDEKPARIALQRAVESKADFPGKDAARRRLEILDIDPLKANPETAQKLEDLVKQDPQDPVPLSRLASIQEQRGEIQKAADSLQKLIAINPENWPAMMRLSRMNADHFNELRKALELAKAAQALAPNDGGATALLGELMYRSGDYPYAARLLRQAADQSPDDASISYQFALTEYAVGHVAAADRAMEKAVQAGDALPKIAQARQFLALRDAVKNPVQAEASSALARQILEKEPNYVPALMVSALISERHGASKEAEATWQKVLTIYPLFAPAMRELAIYYSHSPRAEDQNKAYELAQKAQSSMPDDSELAMILGILAYDHKDWDRSLLSLREISEKSNNDPVVFFYMGMDYSKLNERRECTNALQRALVLGLADNLAGQARTVIKEMK